MMQILVAFTHWFCSICIYSECTCGILTLYTCDFMYLTPHRNPIVYITGLLVYSDRNDSSYATVKLGG